MLRKASVFLCLCLYLLVATTGAFAAERPNVPARKNYKKATALLEHFIQRELQDKKLPAMSVALVDGNQIVWAQGFGFADPEKKIIATAQTVYRVGSVSKLFTDIGIMQLVEQGKINLDAPVSTYLEDFKPANQFAKPITLRQLMSHRAGLLREPIAGHYFDDRQVSLADTVQSLNGRELIYEPEQRVKYSNAGLAVVGYALETVAKQPFTDRVQSAVLAPLGMSSSSFELEPRLQQALAKAFIWTYDGRVFPAPTFEPGMSPAGNLYSTVLDLGRFMIALSKDGRGVGSPVLKADTLAQMWQRQFPNGEPGNFGIGFMLGSLDGHRVVGHGGAVYGFATELEFLPDEKLGAVAVTTMDSANGVTKHVVQEALRLMLEAKSGKALHAIPATEPVSAELIRKVAGRYGDGDKAVDLIQRGNELYLQRCSGGTQMRLRRLGDDLVTDDRLSWGLRISLLDGGIKVGDEILKATAVPKGTRLPVEFAGLVGEYGWDYNILYIIEREGRLMSLIEWYEFEPLEQLSRDVFRYPRRGLYDNEKIVFTRGADGRATQVEVGGVVFKRRNNETVRWAP